MTEAGPEARGEMGRMMEELGYLALAITLAGLYVSMIPSPVVGHHQIPSGVLVAVKGASAATAEAAHAPVWGERVEHVGNIV
ncbi:hypothetical protein GJ744_009105 [Endocarpon pusillum]|uniref:Uncharacterized protein n=1 Tax=Endocarpon pusillum TaxID=364733 RepID=A0A8H7E6F0_9EURO|nr:hypothetical protein GJ744_009105 [Endocarpon pusillum]